MKGCDVQNLTTVIINVECDALWGHLAMSVFTHYFTTDFEKKEILIMKIQ